MTLARLTRVTSVSPTPSQRGEGIGKRAVEAIIPYSVVARESPVAICRIFRLSITAFVVVAVVVVRLLSLWDHVWLLPSSVAAPHCFSICPGPSPTFTIQSCEASSIVHIRSVLVPDVVVTGWPSL